MKKNKDKTNHNPMEGKEIRDNPPPVPMLDTYPPSMRIDVDPVTNATVPTEDAVKQAKRWVDFNIK